MKNCLSIKKFQFTSSEGALAWNGPPTNNLKYQNFEKMKTPPGDIITLHMCTINENHMMHGSGDMKHDRCNYFSFWVIFCPFITLTAQKINILKN